MLHFGRLLDPSFWFTLRPSPLGEKTVLIIAGCFLAMLLAALALNLTAKRKKQNPPLVKVLRKLYKIFSTMAFVGFVLLFFSYEQIYLLGSHFWFLFWFAGLLVWVGFVVYHIIKKMPKEREDLDQRKRFQKYLPR